MYYIYSQEIFGEEEKHNYSREYLQDQIAILLGGRIAEEITMDAVVEALEGQIAPMECFHDSPEGKVLCSHESDGDVACSTKLLWMRVQGGVTKALADLGYVPTEPGGATETESPNHRSVVDVRAVAADGSVINVSGTLTGPQLVEKIVQINGRNLELRAEGVNLILNYGDQPGALGKIGTLLGGADVNILAAQMSQDAEGGGATVMLRLDREVPADVLSAIGDAVGATTLELVDLS